VKYYVTVGDHVREVDLSGPRPIVDGVAIDADLTGGRADPVRHLLLGAKVLPIMARQDPEVAGRWAIHLDGRSAVADVVDERTQAVRQVTGSARIETPKQVVAPMPGLVVRVAVSVADRVTAGQGLVVVEAMKMENEFRAAHDGTVARVLVKVGDTVEKGTVLVVFE
jgi:biotin carboxyl carrier protein